MKHSHNGLAVAFATLPMKKKQFSVYYLQELKNRVAYAAFGVALFLFTTYTYKQGLIFLFLPTFAKGSRRLHERFVKTSRALKASRRDEKPLRSLLEGFIHPHAGFVVSTFGNDLSNNDKPPYLDSHVECRSFTLDLTTNSTTTPVTPESLEDASPLPRGLYAISAATPCVMRIFRFSRLIFFPDAVRSSYILVLFLQEIFTPAIMYKMIVILHQTMDRLRHYFMQTES